MDYKEIKNLIKDMGDSKLDSLSLEFPDGIKVSMTKSDKNETIVEKTIVKKEENNTIVKEEKELGIIMKAPIVGTFYESSAPGKEAFVKLGSKVKKGDIVCIIEAMKLINEIECEADGEIAEIFVKNEEIVDFGKPLFRII